MLTLFFFSFVIKVKLTELSCYIMIIYILPIAIILFTKILLFLKKYGRNRLHLALYEYVKRKLYIEETCF